MRSGDYKKIIYKKLIYDLKVSPSASLFVSLLFLVGESKRETRGPFVIHKLITTLDNDYMVKISIESFI